MAKKILPQDFYVYIHRKADTKQVFYVGKGCTNRAWLGGRQRNRYWHKVTAKHGFEVEIVQDGMQEWWAHELEMELIAFYGRKSLVNLTDGGEGLTGVKHSEETRRKISEGQRGNKRGPETGKRIAAARAGYVTSEETKKKISEASKRKKLSPEHLAKLQAGRRKVPMTEAHKAKMREVHKNRLITDEYRQKLSKAGKGRKKSPETIAKIVAFHTGRKRSEEFKARMREIAKNRSEETRRKQSESLRATIAKKKQPQLELF